MALRRLREGTAFDTLMSSGLIAAIKVEVIGACCGVKREGYLTPAILSTVQSGYRFEVNRTWSGLCNLVYLHTYLPTQAN